MDLETFMLSRRFAFPRWADHCPPAQVLVSGHPAKTGGQWYALYDHARRRWRMNVGDIYPATAWPANDQRSISPFWSESKLRTSSTTVKFKERVSVFTYKIMPIMLKLPAETPNELIGHA